MEKNQVLEDFTCPWCGKHFAKGEYVWCGTRSPRFIKGNTLFVHEWCITDETVAFLRKIGYSMILNKAEFFEK